MGRNAEALAAGSIAIGMNTVVAAGATNAVALGQGSVASDADPVSIGDTDHERRLVHVASGTNATHAVNASQLSDMGSTVASYFGGGAAFANGAWTAPVSLTQGGRSQERPAGLECVGTGRSRWW